jgi:repressor LexA
VKITAIADPRDAVATYAARRGETMAALSRMLRRDARYLDRFVREGRPRQLAADEQRLLADYFDVDARDFGAGER